MVCLGMAWLAFCRIYYIYHSWLRKPHGACSRNTTLAGAIGPACAQRSGAGILG